MMMDSVSTTSFARPDVILFTIQVCVIVIVVISSLINLTFFDKQQELWTMMITSCLGYLMPNPRFKQLKDHTGSNVRFTDHLDQAIELKPRDG